MPLPASQPHFARPVLQRACGDAVRGVAFPIIIICVNTYFLASERFAVFLAARAADADKRKPCASFRQQRLLAVLQMRSVVVDGFCCQPNCQQRRRPDARQHLSVALSSRKALQVAGGERPLTEDDSGWCCRCWRCGAVLSCAHNSHHF